MHWCLLGAFLVPSWRLAFLAPWHAPRGRSRQATADSHSRQPQTGACVPSLMAGWRCVSAVRLGGAFELLCLRAQPRGWCAAGSRSREPVSSESPLLISPGPSDSPLLVSPGGALAPFDSSVSLLVLTRARLKLGLRRVARRA